MLAECVAACVDPVTPTCVACLGGLYQICRPCFDTSDGVETDQLLYSNNTNWEGALCGEDDNIGSSGTAVSTTNGLVLLSAIETIICILKIY